MSSFLRSLGRFLLLACIPLVCLLAGYYYYDPFMVVHDYDDYSGTYVIPNRNHMSARHLLRNKDKYHYNSFILGSSRTLAFQPASWKKHLPADASPYMLDASGESLYGITRKIKFLDRSGIGMQHVLIILCRDASFSDKNETGAPDHLHIEYPEVSGSDRYTYQKTFLQAYFTPRFLFCYYSYRLLGYKEWMSQFIAPYRVNYDPVTNQMTLAEQEAGLRADPQQYYAAKKHLFYTRTGAQVDSVVRIGSEYQEMLQEIRTILDKKQVEYKIVLSPLYDQITFNPEDKKVLQHIFGSHLYDFTGKNYFTDDVSHYYEWSHFRPMVGDSILNLIYR